MHFVMVANADAGADLASGTIGTSQTDAPAQRFYLCTTRKTKTRRSAKKRTSQNTCVLLSKVDWKVLASTQARERRNTHEPPCPRTTFDEDMPSETPAVVEIRPNLRKRFNINEAKVM